MLAFAPKRSPAIRKLFSVKAMLECHRNRNNFVSQNSAGSGPATHCRPFEVAGAALALASQERRNSVQENAWIPDRWYRPISYRPIIPTCARCNPRTWTLGETVWGQMGSAEIRARGFI